MRAGGLAAMLHDLLARDISGFEPRAVPQTEALETQKLLSLDSIDRWWLAVLVRGFVWRSPHGIAEFAEWRDSYATEFLHGSYLQWCGENRVSRPKTREELGRCMIKLYPKDRPRGHRIIGELEHWPPGRPQDDLIVKARHQPGYFVGSLDEARARFADVCDITGDWITAP
jgi:hypothetical protein